MNRCYVILCCSLALFTLALPVAGAEPHKLAVISYMQETCTFCPGGDTEIEDRAWRVPYVKGDDLIDRERGFIGGFVHAAGEYPDVQVIGINSPDEVYGGSSRRGCPELRAFHDFPLYGRFCAGTCCREVVVTSPNCANCPIENRD